MSDLLVQCVSTSNSVNSGVNGEVLRHYYLPTSSLAGNFLFISSLFNHNTTPPTPLMTVKDDTGTTWTQAKLQQDNTAGSQTSFWYRANAPAGIRRVDCSFTAASASYFSSIFGEMYNISTTSPVDGTPTGAVLNGTTALQAGSVTTTVAGDLIMQYAACTSTATGSYWTPATGYYLAGVDARSNTAMQYGTQSVAGPINPTLTAPNPDDYISMTVALKTDVNAGTAPDLSKPHIAHVMWADIWFFTSSFQFQIPTRGNLLVGMWQGSPYIAGIKDQYSNTYITAVKELTQSTTFYDQFIYSLNPTTDLTGIEMSVSASGELNSCTMVFYDIECNFPLAYHSSSVAHGRQTTWGPLSTTTIIPSRPGGIVLFGTSVDFGTLQEISGSQGILADNPWAPNYDGGENALAEDDGWAHAWPTSTSPLTSTWFVDSGPVATVSGVDLWDGVAVSFVPALNITLGGTVTGSLTENNMLRGGDNIQLTAVGATWLPAGSAFDNSRQSLLDGLTSSLTTVQGWNSRAKAQLSPANVVRSSNTVVTITLPAIDGYYILAPDNVTAVITGSILSDSGSNLIAAPTFSIGMMPNKVVFVQNGNQATVGSGVNVELTKFSK
jgi:hypothetical protein